MSRLIKKSIPIPANTTLTAAGGFLNVKGSKGEVKVRIPAGVEAKIEANELSVSMSSTDGGTAIAGTFWSLAKNAIEGATEGFVKTLEIEGVGYRAVVEGKELVLFLGYALPVRMLIPVGVTITVEKNTIKVAGIDKDVVGKAAANIRAQKKPEPYKGKGIHYQGEVIRRKVGKKAGATASAA